MAKISCMVRASVWYHCILSEEESARVLAYAEENNCELEEAVSALYDQACDMGDGILLYTDSTESDFMTEEVESAEVWDD